MIDKIFFLSVALMLDSVVLKPWAGMAQLLPVHSLDTKHFTAGQAGQTQGLWQGLLASGAAVVFLTAIKNNEQTSRKDWKICKK